MQRNPNEYWGWEDTFVQKMTRVNIIYSNTINSKNITDYKVSTTKDANQRLYDLNVHDKHD